MQTIRPTILGLVLTLTAHAASGQAPRGDRCALFKTSEIQKLLGAAVENGESAAQGTACQWFGKDEKSYVIVSVLEAKYFIDPRQAPGYEVIQGVGKRAYTRIEDRGGDERGWAGMALTNGAAASVLVIGATAKRESANALLRQLVDRLGQS